MVCATSKGSDQPAHMHRLIRAFAGCLNILSQHTVKLLAEHHLRFLSLKGGCTGSSESTRVKITTLLGIVCHGSYCLDSLSARRKPVKSFTRVELKKGARKTLSTIRTTIRKNIYRKDLKMVSEYRPPVMRL